MKKKVMIKHNPYGDTRTAPKDTTFKQFQKANDQHIKEVKELLYILASKLKYQGLTHDWTKKDFEHEFFEDFKAAQEDKLNFIDGPWYQKHIHVERHHPASYCHDDINLLDILETIVDCVCAGKARTGEIRALEFDDEIIKKAVKNTVELIDSITTIKK